MAGRNIVSAKRFKRRAEKPNDSHLKPQKYKTAAQPSKVLLVTD